MGLFMSPLGNDEYAGRFEAYSLAAAGDERRLAHKPEFHACF